MSQFEDPNREAVGLEPVWVEGTGGGEGAAPKSKTRNGGETGNDLDEMTKEELLEHAQSLEVVPANKNMSKEELRAGIDAKLAEG